jgi:hypothetical protein
MPVIPHWTRVSMTNAAMDIKTLCTIYLVTLVTLVTLAALHLNISFNMVDKKGRAYLYCAM